MSSRWYKLNRAARTTTRNRKQNGPNKGTSVFRLVMTRGLRARSTSTITPVIWTAATGNTISIRFFASKPMKCIVVRHYVIVVSRCNPRGVLYAHLIRFLRHNIITIHLQQKWWLSRAPPRRIITTALHTAAGDRHEGVTRDRNARLATP